MNRSCGLILILALAGCDPSASDDRVSVSDGGALGQRASAGATIGFDTGWATPAAPSVGTTRDHQADNITASRRSAIATAAERIAPAVVSVNVVRRERRAPRSLLEQFMMPRGYEQLVEGLGSGFIVSADGLIITNEHVTVDAERIVVTTRDGTDYEAQLLGADPLTDIAVLDIDGRDLPTAPTGSSADLVIGEWVVAIGNPYAYLLGNTEPTVTAGVVSAVGRDIVPSGGDEGIYVGMIQTDAAINPGNSGGPLANAAGEVIGVNSSIFSRSGGSVGIGFAIPIERALRVADQIRRFGAVQRSWLGLSVAGPDRLRNWKTAGGLEVTSVVAGGPADRAGIQPGDVLVTAGRETTRTFLDWEAVKLDLSPGDALPVVYRRGTRERTGTIEVEELPSARAQRVSLIGNIELVTLTAAIRQERRLTRDHGALIYTIGEGVQARTGLQAGDLIFGINRQQVRRAEQVGELFERARRSRAPIRVFVERGGREFFTDFYVR